MKVNTGSQKLVTASLFAALTCIATMVVAIPSPLRGYLNLGDCVVLLAGWMLGSKYGFLAAALGSALADMFAGYIIYAPATFAIKGLMAVIAFSAYTFLHKKMSSGLSRLVSGVAAEVFMVVGYLVFETCLYGFGPSLVNVPANGVQGVAGLVLGLALIKLFGKAKIKL